MVASTMVSGDQTEDMAMVLLNGLVAAFTLVNSKTIDATAKERSRMQMDLSIRVNGKMIKEMEKEPSLGWIIQSTLVCSETI